MTNLEKLLTMEYEILSLADVLLREEHFAHQGEDNVHDFSNITKLVEETKVLHRQITSDSTYLSHPINVLHLTRRLYARWPPTLKAFWESEPCQKWKLPEFRARIANMWNNLPRQENVQSVILGLVNILYTQRVGFGKLRSGVLFGQKSLQPATFQDLWDVTVAAYNDNKLPFTIEMVNGLFELCRANKEPLQCRGTALYKISGGAYFGMQNIEKAIEMVTKALTIDPDDKTEKRNLKYYQKRLKFGMRESDIRAPRRHRFYDTCRGDRRKSPSEESRLKCVLLPTQNMFQFERAEFHHLNPVIMELHSTFQPIYLNTMLNSAARKTQEQHMSSKYSTPEVTYMPYKTFLYRKFSTRFLKVAGPLTHPIAEGDVQVRQTGMEGMYSKDQDKKLDKASGHSGSVFTPLNSDYLGGEFVFPKQKVRITPVKGNSIFFFSTKTAINICPVAYGFQWVTMQSLPELPLSKLCRVHDHDLWINGKLRK